MSKCFLGSDETTSRAGFGSWDVVWRPWFSALKCSVKYLKNMRGWQARIYQRAVDIPAFFIHKKQSHLSKQQISPGLVLCSDTRHYCTFLYIYTVTEPSQEVFETVNSWEHEVWHNFSIFVTSLRTLSIFSCFLWHKELLDEIMQPNWMTWCCKQLHEAVSFQVAVPVLGATWPRVPRTSTYLGTNSALERRCACPQRGLCVPPLARLP